MPIEQRYIAICESCYKEINLSDAAGWRFETQPSRSWCPNCKGTRELQMNDTDICQYDEDYFLRGNITGKSLYTDYHWIPELTIPMAQKIVSHLGNVEVSDTILDFGCARGYVVKALRAMGYKAYGIDCSRWAIENCDPVVSDYVYLGTVPGEYDWIIAKDVLEHIPYVSQTIHRLMKAARKGIFVVVPLSSYEGIPYVIADYEKDITHCQRHPLSVWMNMFLQLGWSVEGSYRLKGIKDNYYKPGWEKGNGFITARRIQE